MATTLQRQLAALSTPSSAVLIPERRRSSILFTSQEAAGYGRDTFYQIGLEGLYELISVNEKLFRKFRQSILFDEESKNLERAISEKDTNDKIDEAVEQFLITLSPFLTLKASLKCMEWLVYRFHIEKFNVNSVLKCILPYYDTRTFVLIIQVLEIDKYGLNKEWYWAVPNVQNTLPLSKTALYSNMNARFIGWLFETLRSYLNVHGQENLRIYVSFMTSTIVGVLNGINENPTKRSKKSAPALIHRIWTELVNLLLRIRDGGDDLKSNEEVHSMIYVVGTLLVMIAKDQPDLLKGSEDLLSKVMKLTLKTHPRSLKTQAYLLINALAELSRKKLKFEDTGRLYRVLNELSVLSSEWDLWGLLSKVFLNPTGLEQFFESPNRIWKQLARIEFTVPQRSKILRTIYIKLSKTPGTPKQIWAKKFLNRFEREYPVEFALASQADDLFAKDMAKLCERKDVYLLSQHSDTEIREQAVSALLTRFKNKYVSGKKANTQSTKVIASKKKKSFEKQQIKTCKLDTNPFAQALHPRFSDDNENIVKILVKQKIQVLEKLFTMETLIDRLILVVERRLSINSTRLALQKLIKVGSKVPMDNEELKSKMFIVLTPFLFPTGGKGSIKLATTILSTPFARQDPFFQQYSDVVQSDEIEARAVCNFSYNIFSNKATPYSLWSQNMANACQAVFACLTLNSESNLDNLMAAAEKFQSTSSLTEYPVTKDSFPKCLKMAEKRNILSLELVFGCILKMELTDFASLARVMKFVLRSSLKVENRTTCVKFLQQFLLKVFTSVEAQLNFWCHMITSCQDGDENKLQSLEELEFYLIRTLQFLTSCIENMNSSNGIRGLAFSPSLQTSESIDSIDKAEFIIELLTTQCLLHNSHRVRLGGLNSLQAIVKRESVEQETCSFLNNILSYREEILADKDQVSAIISAAFRENKFPNMTGRFVKIILHSKDRTVVTGLLQLFKSASAQIFAHFIPLVKELLTSDPESEVLLAILDCYDGSLDGTLDIISASMKTKSTCSKILSKFTHDVVEQYDFAMKRKLFANLVDSVLHCETADIKVAVQRCIRKWALEGSMIAAELEKCVVMEKLQSSSGQPASPGQRKQRTTKNAESRKSFFGSVQWTDRAEVILEFLQSEKKLKQKTKLILPLFKLLKICIALEEQSPVEYLKQLILTSMTLCCYQDEKVDVKDDWIHFDVETIIDCLRCSRNPQTHHHALILLNYAARRYPEQVLHGIMSLFTFMGSSILRQDDAYSTQLIQQTVTTIIPTLASTGAVGRFSRGLVSAGIFRVFTSAVQDIPIHRRLPVFTSLVETLDPIESLWQVCIIIVDNALLRDKKRSNLNVDMDLATDLVWSFEPNVVLKTLEKIYIYFSELDIYEDLSYEDFKSTASSQHTFSKAVIDLSKKESLRDVEIVILFTLELVSKICSKFSDLDDQKLTYDFVLEKSISYSRTVSRIREDKIFRLITHRNFEIIGKINAVLEPKDFVRVTKSILERDDLNVKKKMIDMLNHRIIQKAEWFKNLEILLELVPALVDLGSCAPETEEMVTVVQISFLSLKLIARQLASTHPEEFIPVFELCLTHCNNKNRLLCASALLCMSELFCLKSLILSNLQTMCSTILKAFKASAKLNSKEALQSSPDAEGEKDATETSTSTTTANLLCVSAMTCANKLTGQMGSFLGAKFLQKVLITVLSTEGIFGVGEKADNRKKVFDVKLKSLLKTIATKIPLRNSLTPIVKVFKDLVESPINRTHGIILLMGALKETLKNSTEKGDFSTLLPTLTDAFLDEFLTYREKVEFGMAENQVGSPTNEEAEDAIVECLIAGIVLKMSEGVFRPFYHRLLDWASDSLPRLITFYRVSAAAAERLRSLFVTFAGYVITQASGALQRDATLTQAILKYFYQIFLNDREGFITIDRFNALVTPILDLVESDDVISGTISIKEVNEVLIQLAVATNDLNRWQYLIELISLKSQHTNSQVRHFVLSTLEAAGNELGKDFLPLLPPAVPFLAELLTDDDPEVENETRKVLLKLEDIVGEPLQPYFMS